MPGPNFEPTKAILKGWPTPLKFVLLLLIRLFIIFSKFSLFMFDYFSNSFKKSFKIVFDKLFKSFISSEEI